MRKRKKREDEQPPWCYYCDRVFSDEPTLVQHQKAKHFKVAPLLLLWSLLRISCSLGTSSSCLQSFLSCQASCIVSANIMCTFLRVVYEVYVDAVYDCSCALQCTVCHKRLTSAGGLRVHCHQVHRFALEKCAPGSPERPSPVETRVRLLETSASLPTCHFHATEQLLLSIVWCFQLTAPTSPFSSNAGI